MEIPRLSQQQQQQQQQQNQPPRNLAGPPPPHPGPYNNASPSGHRLPLQNQDRSGMRQSNQIPQNKSRRLYVGNIPYHVGISENGMVQLFSALYVAGFRQLSPGETLPVTSFWLHSDGKFGFMELRGDQEAVDCMQFNGVVLHGRPLRVNRPSDYQPAYFGTAHLQPSPCNALGIRELCDKLGGIVGPPAHLAAQAAALPQPPLDGALNARTPTPPSSLPQAGPPMLRSQPQVAAPPPPATSTKSDPEATSSAEPVPDSTKDPTPEGAGTTRPKLTVVSLQHMVADDDLEGPKEEYDDLVEDVKEEGKTHGDLAGLCIPRSGRGRGSVFLAYSTAKDAQRALSSLKERVFNGKTIDGVLISNVTSAEEAAEQQS